MKASSLLLSLAAAAIGSAQDCSQSSEPYYNITSKPFYLVVTSDDGTVNSTLSACHVGAALESLCLSSAKAGDSPAELPATTFQFNTSIYSQAPDPSLGVPGILTWTLQTSTLNVSSSAAFNYDITSNLAVPILSPGSDQPTLVAFDSCDDLAIQAYVPGKNDTQGVTKAFNRWYACNTTYTSYTYNNLAWGLGKGAPDNESCVKVNVMRVFA